MYRHTCIIILQYLALPILKRVSETLSHVVFQYYNALICSAADVVDWLEEMNVDIDDHLPFSPDPNLIKLVWAELKKPLHEQYPGIRFTKNGPKKVKARLGEVLSLV